MSAVEAVPVASYELQASLSSDRSRIEGRMHVRFENRTRAPLTELWWHLYLNGFENARTLFFRTGGAEHRGYSASGAGSITLRSLRLRTGEDLLATATNDPGVVDDRTQLRTPLPRALAPGEALEIEGSFVSVLPIVSARTGRYGTFVFAGQWFPKLARVEDDGTHAHFPFHANAEFYADFGSYALTVTVPSGDVVGAVGRQVGAVQRTNAGDVWRFTAENVHDCAWTSSPVFRERWATVEGIRVRVLYPPGLDSTVERNLRGLSWSIPFYRQRLGPYPYEQLTVVVPPPGADGAGGMEYPTLITTLSYWGEPSWLRMSEYLTAHEYGHQYFYGLLASNEAAWPFLDEGFTEYSASRALDHGGGRGALASFAGVSVSPSDVHGAVSTLEGREPIVALPAERYGSFHQYGIIVYDRTSALLRTAEAVWGTDALWNPLRRYFERYRFRHPGPEDLLASFQENERERAVGSFLRAGFFRPVDIDVQVERVQSMGCSGGTCTGRAVLSRAGSPVYPVRVAWENTNGVRSYTEWNAEGTRTELLYRGERPLRAVWVDPEGVAVIDRRRRNDARLIDGENSSNRSLLVRIVTVLGWLFRGLGP